MLYDSYKRNITYLRISVTDKCNLRCVYCMPAGGVLRRTHKEMLSFEQIRDIVRAGWDSGIRKVRLTGGEPMVKRGIVELVGMLREVNAGLIIGMTTNGTLLAPAAADLKAAGLTSVNVSLDTLDPEEYRYITRGGNIQTVLEGIDAALEAGFPVKLNSVVLEGTGPPPEDGGERLKALERFCFERGIQLQLINHYSLKEDKQDLSPSAVPGAANGQQLVPRRPPVLHRPPDCSECNRIRLLSHGVLKPCLHSDVEVPVDFGDIEKSLRTAVTLKPERGGVCMSRDMVEIGG